MLTLYIRNRSHLAPISDYEYVVMVNAEQIAGGIICGHRREDGWARLVRDIAELHGARGTGKQTGTYPAKGE